MAANPTTACAGIAKRTLPLPHDDRGTPESRQLRWLSVYRRPLVPMSRSSARLLDARIWLPGAHSATIASTVPIEFGCRHPGQVA